MENKTLLDFVTYEHQQVEFSMPVWLQHSRQQYVDNLKTAGLPSQKQEHFRYLNMPTLYQKLESKIDATTLKPTIPEKLTDDSIRLIFINNEFVPTQSDWLPDGVIVLSLKDAFLQYETLLKTMWPTKLDSKRYPFAALALSTFQDGFFFYVAKNKTFAKPFHFLHIVTAANYNKPLRFYYFDENSKINVFEEFIYQNDSVSLQHDCNTIYLEKSAKLTHTILNSKTEAVCMLALTLKDNAEASCVSCVFACDLYRQDMICRLENPFANCKTSGFYQAKDANYIDHHLEILHLAPHTTSDMLFKGTINDSAKAVFNGKLYVEKQAQKITAFQANHHLVFSNQAESYSKPELEIYADDVKCKHGATTAAFDNDAIFYLRSRGLNEEDAKKLMLDAFFDAVISRITLPDSFIEYIKAHMEESIHAI